MVIKSSEKNEVLQKEGGLKPKRANQPCWRLHSVIVQLFVCCFFPTLVLSGCGTTSDSKQVETIRISGSSTMGPMIREFARRYEMAHPEVRIDVQTGGSSRGIAEVGNGLADIGMSSRDLTQKESKTYQSTVVAFDGVGILVHKMNGVQELTKTQLQQVFKGEVRNWKEVGGNDQEIVFVNRAAGRSELSLVSKHFDVSTSQFRPASIAGENQQGIKQVSSNTKAITYMSVGASLLAEKNGETVKLLTYQGVTPSLQTVSSGKYPLARPLIFVTKQSVDPKIQKFLEFCCSKQLHQVVKEFSYVPKKG